MRYEKEDILNEQFPEGYGHSPFAKPLGFDAEDYAPDFERLEDDDEEQENMPSPEPWEEQVRLWGMYPGE